MRVGAPTGRPPRLDSTNSPTLLFWGAAVACWRGIFFGGKTRFGPFVASVADGGEATRDCRSALGRPYYRCLKHSHTCAPHLRATACPSDRSKACSTRSSGQQRGAAQPTATRHAAGAAARRQRCPSPASSSRLWIPVEQVGIVIGRSGQTINKIQGGTSSRLNVVPDQDASAWAPVYIRGAPDGVFAAAQQVVELVDEVDDCVAEFHLGGRGRTLLRDENSGPSNFTLETKKVSADHKVRILIPQATGNAKSDNKPSKDDAAPCSLEGPLDGVKKALKALVEIASRKVEKKRKSRKCRRSKNVSPCRLRDCGLWLDEASSSRSIRVVARYSGTQVAKRPRDQPIPEDAIIAREPEDALSQAALTVESVVEACTEEPTKITSSVISHVLPDENIDNDDFEDPGCSEDESSSESDADEDDDEEIEEVPTEPSKDRIGFMVRGGEKNVDAACQALVQIVEGSSVKDVVAQLKLEFPTAASRRGGRGGKENPPGDRSALAQPAGRQGAPQGQGQGCSIWWGEGEEGGLRRRRGRRGRLGGGAARRGRRAAASGGAWWQAPAAISAPPARAWRLPQKSQTRRFRGAARRTRGGALWRRRRRGPQSRHDIAKIYSWVPSSMSCIAWSAHHHSHLGRIVPAIAALSIGARTDSDRSGSRRTAGSVTRRPLNRVFPSRSRGPLSSLFPTRLGQPFRYFFHRCFWRLVRARARRPRAARCRLSQFGSRKSLVDEGRTPNVARALLFMALV